MILRFTLAHKVIFFMFGICVYTITAMPGAFYTSKIVHYIQLIIFLFYTAVSLDLYRNSYGKDRKLNFFILALGVTFVLFCVSSFVVNAEYNFTPRGIAKLLTYPIVIYLFFFIIPRLFYYNDELFDKFLNFFLIFSVFSSVFALLIFFSGVKLNPKYYFTTVGYFAHPNSIAFVFTFAIPILIYKYFSRNISTGLFFMLLFILAVCFLFTLSRGGYLGVFTAVSILLFRYSKKVFIASIIVTVPIVFYVIINLASTKGDSSYPRLLLALTAYDMIFNRGTLNMYWGYGIFRNIDIFTRDKLLLGSLEQVVDPHNLFLLLAIQFGIIFTISLTVTILYLLLKVIISNKKSLTSSFKNKINLCFAIVVGLIIQNMLEDIIVYPEYFVMPFALILLGYLYLFVYNNKEINKEAVSAKII